MPFTLTDLASEPPHLWCALEAHADLAAAADAVVTRIGQELRTAYGEDDVLRKAEELTADPAVAARFDVEALLRGVREGHPDPEVEASKPAALRTYRSESAEMVARVALADHAGVEFPAAAQVAKGNANQPVLGFDAWGLLVRPSGDALVLVQVKATDDTTRPPSESARLHAECRRAPTERAKIARALVSIVALATDAKLVESVLRMVEACGKGDAPAVVVAPVMVRGVVAPHLADLAELRASPPHARVIGLTIGVGAPLESFGRAVADWARAA